MKLLIRCLLAVCIFVIPETASAQPPAEVENLFQQLSTVIRQAVGLDSPVDVEVVGEMFNAEPDGGAPSQKDVDEFRTRLLAYGRAMQAWIIHSCQLPEEQQERLKEVFEVQIISHLQEFAGSKIPVNRQQYFPATFPITFTLPSATDHSPALATNFAKKIVVSLQKHVLTTDQSQRLESALQERESFQNQAFVESVVSTIDEELFLSKSQREQLRQQLSQEKTPLSHPLYSFQPQSYYLPYEPITKLMSSASGESILNSVQKKRLQDLKGADANSQHVIFQSSTGIDGWYEQMNEVGLQQRGKFLRAAAVRVAWFEKELQLSGEQVEYLSTASKGAAIRAVEDWKESTQQTLDHMEQQMAQMGGNFGFGAQNIDTRAIEKNEVWADAVKVVAGSARDQCSAERSAGFRTAAARSLVALLDDEIWLLPEQRAPFLSLVEGGFPQTFSSLQYQEYIRHLILLAHPLFKTDAEVRDKILTEPQRDVWKQLQSYFQWQKENNYVQLQLRNNGGSFGFMLE